MSEFSLYKRLSLELNRAVLSLRADEHHLHQLFWECTLRCNLNCRHCGSDCRVVAQQQDMPLDDFLKVLDDIKAHVSPNDIMVITTGGEPLVRADIAECGRAITARGFIWGMVTNGMLLTKEKLDELVHNGLRSLAISLDGFADDHNWMRGHSESFANAIRAIEALKGQDGLVWDVITCVNKRTIRYLPEFRNFLIENGIHKWRLFSVFPSGRAANDMELRLSNEEFVQMMDFIKLTRLEGKIDASYACDGFLGRYEGEVRRKYFNCSSGVNVASIRADGAISGCLSIRSDYNQGNIYTDSFWDVWENRFEKFRKRKWMRTGDCKSCKVWRYCQGNGMHLRDENGELMMCQYQMIGKENA